MTSVIIYWRKIVPWNWAIFQEYLRCASHKFFGSNLARDYDCLLLQPLLRCFYYIPEYADYVRKIFRNKEKFSVFFFSDVLFLLLFFFLVYYDRKTVHCITRLIALRVTFLEARGRDVNNFYDKLGGFTK